MIVTLKKYHNIFWQFRKMHLMRTVEYRADFMFWAVVASMWTIFNVFFFSLILNVSDSIGGWTENEMYLLLGVFTIVDAFTWSVFYFNMSRYTNSIYDGELNGFLLKPVNPIFLLMTQYNNYNNVPRLLTGIGLMIWAARELKLNLDVFDIFLFLCVLFLSMTAIYFIWFIMSTFAFYFEKLDNINEIIPNVRRVWQVPRSVFPGAMSSFLTFVLPMTLVVSVPTELLLGKDVTGLLLYLVFFTSITVITASYFFKYSVKRYAGMAN